MLTCRTFEKASLRNLHEHGLLAESHVAGLRLKSVAASNPPGLKVGHWKHILHHVGASIEGTGNHKWEWCYLQTLHYMAIQREGVQTNPGYLVPAQFV